MTTLKNPMNQIFLFFGSEEFLLKERVQNQFESSISKPDQNDWEMIDGTLISLEEILISIQTPPLFSSRKFIWIKNLKILERSHSKNETEFLSVLKAGLPKQNTVIFTSAKIDQRFKIVSELKKISYSEEVGTSEEWFKEQAKEILSVSRKSIGSEAYNLLYSLVGSDSSKFINELEKIITYMGSDKTEIKTSDILAIVSPNNEQPFFRFIDELISKRISFSLKTLRQLILQGENAIGLVTYLLNNLRLLLQARSLIDEGYVSELKIPTTYRKTWVETFIQSLPENLRNSSLKESNFFKQHPYRFFLLLKQSMNFKAAELKNIFLDACEAYWELVNSRPSEKVLEKLTLKIKAG